MAVNPDTPILNTDPFNNLYYDNKLVRSHLNHDLRDPNYYTGVGTITYGAIADNLSDSGTSWDEDNTGLRDLFNQLNLDTRSWPDGFVDSAGDLWTNVPLNTKGYTLLLDSDGKRAIYGVMPFYNTSIVDDNENLPYPDMANFQTNFGRRLPYIHGILYQGNVNSSSRPINVSINYRASELGMITTFYEIKDMLIPGDIMTGKWSKPYHFISGEPGSGAGNYTASPAPFQNKRSVYNLNEIINDVDLIGLFPYNFSPITTQNLLNMLDKNVDTGPSAGGDTLYFNFNKSGTKLYYIRSFIQFDANESISYKGTTRTSAATKYYTFIDGVRPDATHSDYKIVSIMNVLHLDTPWDITSISKHEMKEVFPDNRDKIVAAFSVDSDEKIKTLSRYIGVGEEAGGVNDSAVGYNMPAIDIFEPSYSSSFSLNYIKSEYDPTTDGSLDSAFDPVFYKTDQADILNKSIQSKFFIEDSSKTNETFYKHAIGREHPLVTESRLNNYKTHSGDIIGADGVWPGIDSSSEWTLIKGGYSNVNDKYPDLSLAYKTVSAMTDSANDITSFFLTNPKLALTAGLDNQEGNFVLVKKLNNSILFGDSADENFGTKIFNIRDDSDNERTFPEYRNPAIYSQIHGNIDKTFSFSEGNYDLNSVILYNRFNFDFTYTNISVTAANFLYTKGATKYIKNYYGRFELIDIADRLKTSAFTNSLPTSNSTDSDFFEFLTSS